MSNDAWSTENIRKIYAKTITFVNDVVGPSGGRPLPPKRKERIWDYRENGDWEILGGVKQRNGGRARREKLEKGGEKLEERTERKQGRRNLREYRDSVSRKMKIILRGGQAKN